MSYAGPFSEFAAALTGEDQVALVYATANGEIGFWNAGAEGLFGHKAAETAGRRVDLIVPPEHRERHWAGFFRAIGSQWCGSDAWGEIEALHKDGSRVGLEVFLLPVHRNGRVFGVLANFRRPHGADAS